MTRIARLLVIATIAAIAATAVIATPTASAQPTSKDAVAREHFRAGQALVADSKYQAAYDEFAAGFELSGRTAFLFNMGETALKMKDIRRARAAFQQYLTLEPTGELSDIARARLAATAPAPAPAPEPKRDPVPAPAAVQPPAAPAPAAGAVFAGSRDRDRDRPTPLLKRWTFWAGVGAVVAAGAVTTYLVTRSGDTCGAGCSMLDLRD